MTGATISGEAASSYQLTITEMESGCTFDTSITIPYFPNVTAYFTPNPNGGCLPESDPVAEFIDLCQGAASGLWDFGDGATENYTYGQYPSHEYADTGQYLVTLHVENDLGTCIDDFEYTVCVQSEFKLWIPSAFTPDGDGLNDLLEIVSSGIVDFEFEIFDRWGTRMFSMDSISDPWWDGTFKGNPVPQGQYFYRVYARARHVSGYAFQKSDGSIFVYRHDE